MKIASLGKNLRIYPFKAKLVIKEKKSFFEWGSKFKKKYIPLHEKYPPYMKCIDSKEGIHQISNGYAYFINRNKFVIADDRKKDKSDILICVGLRLKKDHKGKCIMVEQETKRLYYDYKVTSQKYPDFCFINAFVFIKSGEKATLIDYLPTGEYSQVLITQNQYKEWVAERNVTPYIVMDEEIISSKGEKQDENVSPYSEN